MRSTLSMFIYVFRSSLRSRILLSTLLFAAALTALSVAAASVSIGEERGRLIIDVGLFFASAVGALVAIALTTATVAQDIKRRTAYPILARPVPRWTYVLGQFLGISATVSLVALLLSLSTALLVGLFGASISSAFVAQWWMINIELWIAVAISLCFSLTSSPAVAASLSGGFVLAGHLSLEFSKIADKLADTKPVAAVIARTATYVVPDFGRLSLRPEAANDLPIPDGSILAGTTYGILYAAVFVTLGALVFSKRRSL